MDTSIPLSVRPQDVRSPLESLQRGLSVADMISGMQDRAQLAKLRAADVRAANLKLQEDQKTVDEKNAFDQVLNDNLTIDPDTKDVAFPDDATVLKSLKAKGVGHLFPKYDAERNKLLSDRRTRLSEELESSKQQADAVSSPIESFLEDADATSRAAKYPALVETLKKINPKFASQLPAQYDPRDTTLQNTVAHAFSLKDQGERLKYFETREQNRIFTSTPDELWKADHPDEKDGKAPKWFVNAIQAHKDKISTPPTSLYQDRKITAMTGDNLPEDAIDRTGKPIPPDQRARTIEFDVRQDPDGQIYYQVGKTEKATTKEKEHERTERGYAFAMGKKYEDLTPEDKIKADSWYTKLTPAKQTEFDKRLSLYSKDPQTYAALYGHGVDVDKPLTSAQKASILNQINNQIARQLLNPKEAAAYKTERVNELKDAGIDLSGVKEATAPAKGAPQTKATPPAFKIDDPVYRGGKFVGYYQGINPKTKMAIVTQAPSKKK